MYTVVRDDEYLSEIDVLEQTFTRVQELDDAITWALERKPLNIPGSLNITGNWFIWTTEEFFVINMPKLRIIYEVDEVARRVKLQCIDQI